MGRNERKKEREGKVEPSEGKGKKGIAKSVPKSPQQMGQIHPKHMTTTQRVMVQKRLKQNIEAAQRQ